MERVAAPKQEICVSQGGRKKDDGSREKGINFGCYEKSASESWPGDLNGPIKCG